MVFQITSLPNVTQPFIHAHIKANIKENIKAPKTSPVTGEFPAQMASNAENVSIWWHHRGWKILLMHYSASWRLKLLLSQPFIQQLVQRNNKENINAPHFRPSLRWIYQQPVHSSRKVPVMPKVLPWHDVLMTRPLSAWRAPFHARIKHVKTTGSLIGIAINSVKQTILWDGQSCQDILISSEFQ